MTDFDPTDDDLVSAYLDDEATTAEAAAVDARPELVARIEEVRSIQEMLAAPADSTPSGASQDDMISAALGQFGRTESAEVHRVATEEAATAPRAAAISEASNQTPPRPMATERSGERSSRSGVADLRAARERKNRRGVWLLSAAAAVLLAVAIPAALNNMNSGEDSSTATETADMALEPASSDAYDEGGEGGDSAGGVDSDADAAMDDTQAAGSAISKRLDEQSEDAAAGSTAAAPATTAMAALAESEEDNSAADTAGDIDVAEADAALEEELELATDSSTEGLNFFAITPTIEELLVTLEEPGFLEELEATSQEFGAPIIECSGEGELGGLAQLTADGQVVEIIVPSNGAESGDGTARIVDRQTCAVLATFER